MVSDMSTTYSFISGLICGTWHTYCLHVGSVSLWGVVEPHCVLNLLLFLKMFIISFLSLVVAYF